MQFAILITLVLAVVLLGVILAKVGSRKQPEQAIREQFSSLANTLNSRLDSVQQGLLTNLNATLQTSSQALTTSIAGVKEETRSRIDERVMAFTTELRSAFDLFREQIEGRFGTLET
jgi:predicted PurR-regulated permease PerM